MSTYGNKKYQLASILKHVHYHFIVLQWHLSRSFSNLLIFVDVSFTMHTSLFVLSSLNVRFVARAKQASVCLLSESSMTSHRYHRLQIWHNTLWPRSVQLNRTVLFAYPSSPDGSGQSNRRTIWCVISATQGEDGRGLWGNYLRGGNGLRLVVICELLCGWP